MRISDWSSDVCSSDLVKALTEMGTLCSDWLSRWAVTTMSITLAGADARPPPSAAGGADFDASSAWATDGAIKPASAAPRRKPEIGRASCRERVCKYVWISVGGVYLKKNIQHNT